MRFTMRPLLMVLVMGFWSEYWIPIRSQALYSYEGFHKVFFVVTWYNLVHKEENGKEEDSNPHG